MGGLLWSYILSVFLKCGQVGTAEGNNIAMTSSTPPPSAITISSLPSNDFMDHSIVLEMVPDESTMHAAEAVGAKHCYYDFSSSVECTVELIFLITA
eukprot:14372699-Ditylum_brightwellii.AAC.2